MTIALDGTVTNGTAASNAMAAAITTTATNDIILAYTYNDTNTGVTTSFSGGGLTWTQKHSVTYNSAASGEMWYAVAASPLTAQTITAQYTTMSTGRIVILALSGGNITTIFDTNANANLSTSQNAGTTITLTETTSNANAMLVAAGRFFQCGGFSAGPTSFVNNISGGTGSFTDVSNLLISAPISAVAQSYTTLSGASCMFVDAILAASVAAPKGSMMAAF